MDYLSLPVDKKPSGLKHAATVELPSLGQTSSNRNQSIRDVSPERKKKIKNYMARRAGHVSDDLDMMAQILNIKSKDTCAHVNPPVEENPETEESDENNRTPPSGDEEDADAESYDGPVTGLDYQDEAYWKLPENVRHAVDLSKRKSKRSDFCKQLTVLNGKVDLYKALFYSKVPVFEETYQERQRKKKLEIKQKMKNDLERMLKIESEKSLLHHQNRTHSGSRRNLFKQESKSNIEAGSPRSKVSYGHSPENSPNNNHRA